MAKVDRKNLIILVLLIILATVVFYRSGNNCSSCLVESATVNDPDADISASNASIMIQNRAGNPDFVILDVRTPKEFKAGHIEDAINLDYDTQSFKDNLNDMDKEITYLVYSRNARRSVLAINIMKGLDFAEAYNMSGGIVEWEAEGLPIVH